MYIVYFIYFWTFKKILKGQTPKIIHFQDNSILPFILINWKNIFYITENAFKDKNCPLKTEPSMINHKNSNLNLTKFRSDFIIFY